MTILFGFEMEIRPNLNMKWIGFVAFLVFGLAAPCACRFGSNSSDNEKVTRHLKLPLRRTSTTEKNEFTDDAEIFEGITIHRKFTDENSSDIFFDIIVETSLTVSITVSVERSILIYIKFFLAGFGASAYIFRLPYVTGRSVALTNNNNNGRLCNGCHQTRATVRLVSCRPYHHFLCDSCFREHRYCPVCNILIRAYM